jgi:hypothetical protein
MNEYLIGLLSSLALSGVLADQAVEMANGYVADQQAMYSAAMKHDFKEFDRIKGGNTTCLIGKTILSGFNIAQSLECNQPSN